MCQKYTWGIYPPAPKWIKIHLFCNFLKSQNIVNTAKSDLNYFYDVFFFFGKNQFFSKLYFSLNLTKLVYITFWKFESNWNLLPFHIFWKFHIRENEFGKLFRNQNHNEYLKIWHCYFNEKSIELIFQLLQTYFSTNPVPKFWYFFGINVPSLKIYSCWKWKKSSLLKMFRWRRKRWSNLNVF